MKSCPRCRALAFDDLPTCYNCLYPFELPGSRKTPPSSEQAAFDGKLEDPLDPDEPDESIGPAVPCMAAKLEDHTGTTRRLDALPRVDDGRTLPRASFVIRVQCGFASRPYGVLITEGQTLQVGRSKTCDIVLDEPDISRRHASVRLEAGEVWVDDLDSHNGTFLNGRRLEHAERMIPGDRLSIGRVRLGVEKADVR